MKKTLFIYIISLALPWVAFANPVELVVSFTFDNETFSKIQTVYDQLDRFYPTPTIHKTTVPVDVIEEEVFLVNGSGFNPSMNYRILFEDGYMLPARYVNEKMLISRMSAEVPKKKSLFVVVDQFGRKSSYSEIEVIYTTLERYLKVKQSGL